MYFYDILPCQKRSESNVALYMILLSLDIYMYPESNVVF